MNDLRSLPSVETLLQTSQVADLIVIYGRPLTIEAIRAALVELRSEYKEQKPDSRPNEIFERTTKLITRWTTPTLIPVINATGVILHTNLGRAPLSRPARQAIQYLGDGYSSLEYDLVTGERGSRYTHTEAILKRLTGAEAAIVVNNNAAAVLISLSALARHKRVIISRTQLVEIGGGFRVPAVMSQSGAKLCEIGTTNRVNLDDYKEALNEPAGMILHVHPSNFKITGFTEEPGLKELVTIGKEFNVPVIDDLGSGSLLDTSRYGLAHEITVIDSLNAGVDLVCFSGDKLLGGPQAGIIIGKTEYINKIKKHPLTRAVRPDKLCLAALNATLLHYLKNEAEKEIPVWQMISMTPEEIHSRAQHWQDVLGFGEVIPDKSTVGGGSLPGETLPTFIFAINISNANRFMAKLRALHPPIIGRTQEGKIVFDPRTVLPDQDDTFLVGLKTILN